MDAQSLIPLLIERIRNANPDRQTATLKRRISKLLEEVGELSEAWLNVTSTTNGKGKAWEDVREEAADCLIVAVDIHLTGLNGTPADITHDVRLGIPDDFQNLKLLLAQQAAMAGVAIVTGDFRQAAFYAAQAATNAIDICLTPLPDQPDATLDDLASALDAMVTRKLAKWTSSRASRVSEDAKADDAV
jgi:CheY-like chemotaxis protein